MGTRSSNQMELDSSRPRSRVNAGRARKREEGRVRLLCHTTDK